MHGRLVAAGALAATTMLAVGGLAIAAIPSGSGVFHGCYAKKDGSLRLVDKAAQCTSHEVGVAWNRRGQQGPSGAPGSPGPSGPPGVTHAYYQANAADQSVGSGYSTVASLSPPAGADYLVLATGAIQNVTNLEGTDCELVLHSGISNANTIVQRIEVDTNVGDGLDTAAVSLSATVFLPAVNSVRVICGSSDATGHSQVLTMNLSAMPVDAIN